MIDRRRRSIARHHHRRFYPIQTSVGRSERRLRANLDYQVLSLDHPPLHSRATTGAVLPSIILYDLEVNYSMGGKRKCMRGVW